MVGDNVEPGLVALEKGLAMANDLELDLVEISSKTDPPKNTSTGKAHINF